MNKKSFQVQFHNPFQPFNFINSDGGEFSKTIVNWGGMEGELIIKVYTENEKKTLRAHKYFVGVVCPCVCHAYFEAGHISKATFKILTTEDCIEITKSIFFKKAKIGQNTWTHYSVKVSEWDADKWTLKVQSIIDALQDRFEYTVPDSNTKHEKNFLERLQK
jgi:hypothetical protein